MKFKKITLMMLLLVTSILLVGCKGKEDKPKPEEKPTDELTLSDLKGALRGLRDNYELNIEVLVYDEVEAQVEIKVEGNKSSYKEGDYVEFYYIREGTRDLTVIEKKGDHFEKSTERERKDSAYDIFDLVDEKWFEVKSDKFQLKDEHKEDLLKLFNFSEDVTLLTSTIKLDDDKNLSSFNISFEENRDPYYLNIEVKNINGVTILVPEVK